MEVRASIGFEETVEEITLPTTRNCYLSNQQPHHLNQVPTSQGPVVAATFSLSFRPDFSSNRNPLIYPVLPSWSGAGDSWHHRSLDPRAGPSYLTTDPVEDSLPLNECRIFTQMNNYRPYPRALSR